MEAGTFVQCSGVCCREWCLKVSTLSAEVCIFRTMTIWTMIMWTSFKL